MIRVSAAEMLAKADELENLNNQFKTQIDALEATEGTLIGMWEGETKEAFHTAFHNDKVQLTNFYNAIKLYVLSLRQIAARYQQAEATNMETATARTYH